MAFLSHFRKLGSDPTFWYVLAANSLMVTAFSGVLTYLAAYLIKTYFMDAGETVLPLTLAGLGVIIGAFMGGRVAGLLAAFRWSLFRSCLADLQLSWCSLLEHLRGQRWPYPLESQLS